MSPRLVLSVLLVVFVLFVLFVVFVGFVVFVWFVCTFLEKGKEKSIGESMALHSSAAPCYGASAIAGACGAQVLVLWFVCPAVRLSVRPFVVVLFVLLFLARFWVLQSVGPWVWSGWRCAVSPGPPSARVPRRRLSYPG